MDIPNPCKSNVEEDCRPAHAADQAQGNNDNGERNHPIDIFSKEDLVCGSITLVQGRWYDTEGEVRRHRKVSHGADEQSNGEKIVENSLSIAGHEAEEVENNLMLV